MSARYPRNMLSVLVAAAVFGCSSVAVAAYDLTFATIAAGASQATGTGGIEVVSTSITDGAGSKAASSASYSTDPVVASSSVGPPARVENWSLYY